MQSFRNERSAFLIVMAVRPKPVVIVPGTAMAGVYNSGDMPESVMVQSLSLYLAQRNP